MERFYTRDVFILPFRFSPGWLHTLKIDLLEIFVTGKYFLPQHTDRQMLCPFTTNSSMSEYQSFQCTDITVASLDMRRLHNSFCLVFLRTLNSNGYFRDSISAFHSRQTHSFRTFLSEEKFYQLSLCLVQPIFQNIFSLSVLDVSSSQLANKCSWIQQSSAAVSGTRKVLSGGKVSVSESLKEFYDSYHGWDTN
jgi:hypothetical protein